MAGLRIALLGGLEIVGCDNAAGVSLTKKARALLAYLALQRGQPQSRERLANLLWGTSAEKQARANLRQTLSTLRKAFNDEDYLVTDGDCISLDLIGFDLDVTAFEQAVTEPAPESLKRTAVLYKGDLLDGFSLREELFEAWVGAERERLRVLAVGALTKLVAYYDDVGETECCIGTATRLLTLDPLHEEVHRMLMHAYAAQGRQTSALKQFETCRGILMRELGVEPERKTVELYRKIRRQRAKCGTALESDGPGDNNGTNSANDGYGEGLRLPEGPSVVVLPFENKGGDPQRGYLADGITENIIGGLSRFRNLFVIALKSSYAARDSGEDVQELGRRLGVAHIVEGTVRRTHNRVRLAVQLIDAATGCHVWAEHYDRDIDKIYEIQDDVTNIIIATLAGRIDEANLQRAAHKPTKQLVAYDYLLRARQCLNRYTQEGELQARRYLERALSIDPEFAAAYAGLAISYIHEYEAAWSELPIEALERAYELSHKALALDDAQTAGLYALASAYHYRGQNELALLQIDKALAINPNDYHNICSKAWFLAFGGKPSEGIACSHKAMRLNPFTPDSCLYTIGAAEYITHRYKAAIEAFGKINGPGILNLKPAWLAASYAQLGRHAQANLAVQEVRRLATKDPAMPKHNGKEAWHCYWARLNRFENPEDFEHFMDGLRKAGLPG